MDIESLNNNPRLSELIPLTYSQLVNNIDILKQKNVKSVYSFFGCHELLSLYYEDTNRINLNSNSSDSYHILFYTYQ